MKSAWFIGMSLALLGGSSAAQATDRWFFASDVHEYGNSNLKPILQNYVKNSTYNVVTLVGDYQRDMTSNRTSYLAIKSLMDSNKPSGAVTVMSQGNHDVNCASPGCYTHASGGTEMSLGNSDLYVINAKDFCASDTAYKLANYLLAHWTGEAVVVLGHYPIHSTRFLVEKYPTDYVKCDQSAKDIFSVLQIAATCDGRDVIYVWGHNHSQSKWDTGMDYILTPGETMPSGTYITDSLEGQKLQFVYLNAGYIKPRSGESTSHWSKVSIDSDKVRIYRDGSNSATEVARPFIRY